MKPKLKHVSESDLVNAMEELSYDRDEKYPRELSHYGTAADFHGGYTRELISCNRAFAIYAYLLEGDIDTFRKSLKQCAQYEIELFERYDKGDLIAISYLATPCHEELSAGLAAGAFDVAVRLAELIGGRKDVEKSYYHRFVTNFCYTLKYVVLKDFKNANIWLEKLKLACAKEGKAYKPFAPILEGILNGDAARVGEHFIPLLKGHRRICGSLHPSIHRHIAIGPLGLLNLARGMYGLDVEVKNDLIPEDLIVAVGTFPKLPKG